MSRADHPGGFGLGSRTRLLPSWSTLWRPSWSYKPINPSSTRPRSIQSDDEYRHVDVGLSPDGVSPATLDVHDGDTVGDYQFVSVLSCSCWSSVA